MAQSVDTKIVELKFNNDNFKDKVDSTLTKLEQLNKDISNVGLNDAFKNLGRSAKQVDISGVSNGVQEATKHFSKLEVMGVTALANLTNSAVNFGKKLVSNIVNPIVQGGLTRAQNIKQAKFLFEGMNVFSKSGGSSYKEVMDAVTDTAYGYDQAAKAAAQLAASNVGVKKSMKTLADGSKIEAKQLTKDMTTALQAIAGVAAMTGSDFDSIAQIFTRVAGQGRVMATDLNSIATRGLNAAAVLGASLGKTEAEIRDLVSKGKVSFAEFSQAMSDAYGAHAKDANMQFTGALSNMKAALARIGEKFYDPLLDAGRDLINSVTPVINLFAEKLSGALEKTDNIIRTSSKRLSQYIDLFDMVLGVPMKGEDEWIKSHMNAWTNLADLFKMGDAYQAAEGLKAYTKSLKEFSGKEGIDGFQMVADYLGKEVKEVKKELKEGTIGFNTFYQSFKKLWTLSDELMGIKDVSVLFDTYVQSCILASGKTEEFTKAYNTLNSILKGGKDILNDVSTILKSFGRIFIALLDHLRPFGPIIKDIVKQFAQFTVQMADYMAKSKTLNKVIDDIVNAMAKFFTALNVKSWAPAVLTGIGNAFSFIAAMVEKIDSGLKTIIGAINKVFGRLIDSFMKVISNGEELRKIMESFKNAGIIVLAVRMINGLLKPAEILETISNAIKDTGKSITGLAKSVGKVFDSISGMLGKIGKVLDEVCLALKKWQEVLMAATLVEIGLAILIIAGALYALSKVKAPDLVVPLATVVAIAATFAKMLTVFDDIKKSLKPWESFKNPFGDAGSEILKFAISVAIIATALYKLGNMDEHALGRSFLVIEALLVTLAGIAKLLSGKETKTTGLKSLWSGTKTKTGGLTKSLGGLVSMAIAVRILANAIKSIATAATPEELFIAGGVIEALLITLAIITKWLSKEKPEKMTKGITSLIALALAVRMLAKPIQDLAMAFSMDPKAAGIASGVVSGFLIAMAGITALLSKTEDKGSALKGALSMVIMAKSLQMVADAISQLAMYDWASLKGAIGSMAAALAGLVLALTFLSGIGDSSMDLLLSAGAILVLAESLKVLGEVSILVGKNIDAAAQGLYVMGGALAGILLAAKACEKIKITAIGKLALVIIELIAATAGFGVAMGILGMGIAVFGASLKSLSAGVATLYEVGDALFLLTVALGAMAVGIVAMPEVLLALGGLGLVLGIIAAAINIACAGFEKMAAAMSVLVSLDGKLKTVSDSIKTFVSAIKETKGDMKSVGEAYEVLAEALGKIAEAFDKLHTSVAGLDKELKNLLGRLATSMTQITSAVTTLSKVGASDLDNAALAIKSFVTSLANIKNDSTTVSDAVLVVRDKIELMMTAINSIVESIKTFGTEAQAAFQTVSDSVHSISDPIIALVGVKDKISEVKTEMENFITSIANLKDRAPEVEAATGAMKSAVENIKEPLKILAEELEKFHWSIGDILEHIGNGAIGVANGFTRLTALKQTLPGTADAISTFLADVYKSLGQMEDFGSKMDAVGKAVKKLADNAKSAVKNLDTSAMVKSGESMANAMAKGINNSKAIVNALDKSAQKAKKKYDTFKTVGEYLVKGLIAGINSQLDELEAAVQKLEAKAERAVKAEAKIKSPSRVWMQIGAYMGEGLAIGIRNSGARVASESAGLAESSENAVRAAIMSISDAMESDFNLDPIITPVVDLSNIDDSARLISSKFGAVGVGPKLANSIGGSVQNGSLATNATMSKLNKTLSAMTDSMNSRSLNNYITIDGSSDPEAFADDLIRSFRLNARTV